MMDFRKARAPSAAPAPPDPSTAASRPAVTPCGPSPSAAQSELSHWPVQLALLPPEAPFYRDAELVLAADCAAYALPDFHQRFLRSRALAIACPKLDDVETYVDKLAQILRRNPLRGLLLVHMEVPCCAAIVRLAREAAERSGRVLPVRDVTISLRGEVLGDELSVIGR